MELCQLVTELELLCNAEPGSLGKDSVIEAIPGWSSMAFLGLIAAADETYGIALKPRHVMQCSTISDLFSLLQALKGDVKSESNPP